MVKYFIFFNLFLFTLSVNLHSSSPTSTNYNVLCFGEKGNGVTDSTQAFIKAWAAACAFTESSTIYVPKGRYLLGSVVFKGDCKSSDIAFRIDGTLAAPADYRVLGKADNWFSFEGVNSVSIIGGAIDAKTAGNNCPNGAAVLHNFVLTISFTNSKKIKIIGLMSLNSQMFHIVINGCQDVHVEGVKVIAAGDSPNTDGIHVQLSRNVVIMNSSIKTGDDCISISPGTKNLWIECVKCDPGHRISIGSLAKDMNEEDVKNVTDKKIVFTGAQNGLRIKSWPRPSNGFVQGIRYISAVMQNVQNPIVVDKKYCPHNLNCPTQVSGVKISDVTYQGIRGTSATPIGIKFCRT